MERKIHSVEERIGKIIDFLKSTEKYGMKAEYSSEWPVKIRLIKNWQRLRQLKNYPYTPDEIYEYTYPYAFFDNIQRMCPARILYDKKSERKMLLKALIDNHMSGDIDVFRFHLGLYILRPSLNSYMRSEEIGENFIGKRRLQFLQTVPLSNLVSTDDFFASIWSNLIRTADCVNEEYNPYLEEVRILFSPNLFAEFTGRLYEEGADWVEPLSGKADLEVTIWTKVSDPMMAEPLPEGWTQGKIRLVNEIFGNKHYVNNTPLHPGSAIMVKFDKGWIKGRYECDLINEGPIKVWSHNNYFIINEGHEVRVQV